jgi:chorismate mutase
VSDSDQASARRDRSEDEPRPSERLEALRSEIRVVDEALIGLVKRRRDLALAIGRTKAELGLPVMDPSQEALVVRRAAETARALDVDEELTRDVIWRIIASARDAQEGRSRWGPPPTGRIVPDEDTSG